MLTILEDIKAEAEHLIDELRAGVHVVEADLKWLAEKAEDAITIHKAATEEVTTGFLQVDEPAPDVKELPAGYPPITPS